MTHFACTYAALAFRGEARPTSRRRPSSFNWSEKLMQVRKVLHETAAAREVLDAGRLALADIQRAAVLGEGEHLVAGVRVLVSRLAGVDDVQWLLTMERAPSVWLPPAHRLTSRQLAVVERIVAGVPTAEVAEDLGIAVGTVRKHVKVAMGTLGVHSRLELAALLTKE